MSECLPGCICMCGHEEDIHIDGRCWRAEGPGPMYCGCSDYEPKVHAPHCHKNAPKPEPPKDALPKPHDWKAASNGVITCALCGVVLRDLPREDWLIPCPGEPPPDVASEPDFECDSCGLKADDLAIVGHLRAENAALRDSAAVSNGQVLDLIAENAALKAENAEHRRNWDLAKKVVPKAALTAELEQLLQSSARVAKENELLKAALAQAKQLDPVLVGIQHAALRSQRDEASAEAEKAKERTLWAMTRLSDVDAKLANLETAHAKLRKERDAAEAILLTLCSKGGPRTAGIWDDADAVVAAIKRRREEKGGE